MYININLSLIKYFLKRENELLKRYLFIVLVNVGL